MSSGYLNGLLGQKLDRALALASRLDLASLSPTAITAMQALRSTLDGLPLAGAGENITALVRLSAVEKLMVALDTFVSAAGRPKPLETA